MLRHLARLAPLLLVVAQSAWAFKAPPLTGPVVDGAQVLSGKSRATLESIVRLFEKSGRAQIQILTVASLEGLAVEEASIQVVDQWKLGTQVADNGVLILVAPNDRKMRIEVGQGLEGDLPDAYAKRITDQMTPFFKEGRYGDGIVVGVAEVIRRIDPQFDISQVLSKEMPRSRRNAKDGSGLFGFIAMIIIFFVLSRFGGPGGRGRGASFVTGMILGSMSRGGGRSGGGGWSGGGGGFSGGGSSGSW